MKQQERAYKERIVVAGIRESIDARVTAYSNKIKRVMSKTDIVSVAVDEWLKDKGA